LERKASIMVMDAPPALEATNLTRRFGRRLVLRNLDLAVPGGCCVALVGANGSGKTTLLRCLAGVLKPTAGQVRWFGRPAGTAALRHLVGLAAHESFLYPHLTARENLRFAARMHALAGPSRQADAMVDQVGLARHADLPVARLSKGLRQRAAVARALIHDPLLVLFDEPFAGLDAEGAAWLADLIARLRERGRALCFSTHDLPSARRLADRVVSLEDGHLREVGRQGLSAGDVPWGRQAA
jgi:heme ABC exporter ATP-binding subunit CcmA